MYNLLKNLQNKEKKNKELFNYYFYFALKLKGFKILKKSKQYLF